MRALGLPESDIERLRAEQDADVFGLLEENAATLALYQQMQTQWRVGMAGATGLDYTALAVVFDIEGTPAAERPKLFAGLRVMEAEMLDVWSKRDG